MKNVLSVLFLVLISLLLYSLTIRGFRGNPITDKSVSKLSRATGPFESSHERAPYALIVSLVENKSFELTQELADFASPDTVWKDGKFFIIFPPGMSIIAMPFYLLGKEYNFAQLVTFAGMAIFAIVNILMIYLISRNVLKLSSSLSILASLIFGFSSTAWSFAASLYQHQAAVFLMLASFYAAWKYKQARYRWFWSILVWASAGLIIWLDVPSFSLMVPVIIYLALNSLNIQNTKQAYRFTLIPTFLITSLVFFIIIAAQFYYNFQYFGSPLRLAQLLPRYDASAVKKAVKENKQVISEREKNKSAKGTLQEEKLPNGLNTLIVAPDKGLFFFSPIFILAVLGIFSAIKKKKEQIVEIGILSSIFIVNLIFYSSWGDPWGGWAYGPRYLIPSMAVLSIFVVIWLEKTKYRIIGKFIAFILFVYSAGISLIGVLTTTITPPKVEADYLKIKYGFFMAWDYFIKGKSRSFVFNEFASKYMNLQQYFLIIYIPLILMVFVLLFVLPMFESRKFAN